MKFRFKGKNYRITDKTVVRVAIVIGIIALIFGASFGLLDDMPVEKSQWQW